MSESLFLQTYNQIADKLPGNDIPWLVHLRQQAFKQLQQQGLPHHRLEDWKYTDLSFLEQQTFTTDTNTTTSADNYLQEADYYHITFLNGVLQPLSALPEGLTITPLAEQLAATESMLGSLADVKIPGIAALNTLFLNQGIMLNVAANTAIDKPIHLLYLHDAEQAMHHYRNVFVINQGAEINIVESHVGATENQHLTTVINEIFADQNSHTHYVKVQKENAKAYHLSQLQVAQQANSHFHYYGFDLGSKLTRNDIQSHLNGKGAHCDMYGLFLLSNRQHVDNHTAIFHNQPHTTSNEYFKGIAKDRAKGIFNGKVFVKQDAQQVDAQQQSKNLLLSDKAEINTKPQLEIFADDVKCSHGATIGSLDEDSLFYLQSRGINKDVAQNILTFGFAEEIVNGVPLTEVKQQLMRWVLMELPTDKKILEYL